MPPKGWLSQSTSSALISVLLWLVDGLFLGCLPSKYYCYCSSNGTKSRNWSSWFQGHMPFRIHSKGEKFFKGKKHWGRRTTGIKALITPEDTCFRTEAISQNKGLLQWRPKLDLSNGSQLQKSNFEYLSFTNVYSKETLQQKSIWHPFHPFSILLHHFFSKLHALHKNQRLII